ncbi:hypothetical protein [Pseudarthrobacter sp. NamB4]|uniref:hypothetical protein n=1 Tax=Pseudarthrobacter sp. NamB4 TaxID=2576837 RepID=UPI0010FD548A|nr:hypothetical protein [Pseudarthrobacter sp. NamB4]TLM73134.1 hypothetical protein FDW81_10685 [Pseudarthrobacter sp. NamB4]
MAVQIAHIKGANEGSARYDPTMTDAERAAFSNLMLMCTTHHKLIDGPKGGDYPVELLQGWKADHELGVGALPDGAITADNFEQLLDSFVSRLAPFREIAVDLEASLWIPGNTARMPFRDLATVLAGNPHLKTFERGVVTTVRNTGTADVTVADISLLHVLGESAEAAAAEVTLMGRNDYLHFQKLPHRLSNGDSMDWLTKSATIAEVEAAAVAQGKQYSALYARVRLASGEQFKSPPIPWPEVAIILAHD